MEKKNTIIPKQVALTEYCLQWCFCVEISSFTFQGFEHVCRLTKEWLYLIFLRPEEPLEIMVPTIND